MNYRPDLKFMYEKLDHWANQLNECRNYTYYSQGINRLQQMKTILDECSDTIQSIIAESSSTKSKKQENNVEDDLNIVFDNLYTKRTVEGDMYESLGLFSPKDFYSYDSKYILSTFLNKLKELCSSPPTGVSEVTQLCYLLYTWFTSRYFPKERNDKFFYKAERIYEWIDILIIASGYAIHEGTFSSFKMQVDNWSRQIQTNTSIIWPLPREAFQIRGKLDSLHCLPESVLLERLIKNDLYDDKFYPYENNRIYQIVQRLGNYSEDDLRLSNILENCSNFTVTSSLDLSRY